MAVADELRASGAEVSFLGTRERIEAELVPAAGYEMDFIKVRGIDRRNPLRAARAGFEALGAVGATRKVLRRRGADAVVGGGGYVAGPAGLAAAMSGTPLVLTEADSHLGLANRLLARRARRVCLAFPIEGREGDPYLVTGRPVPKAVLEGDRARARERFGIAADARCLLVFGGSQGARSINLAAIEAFAERDGREFDVVHVAAPATSPSSSSGSPPRPTPSATRCSPMSPTSATRWPRPTSFSRARAARSSRWSPSAGPRSWFRIPSPPPITRPPTPSGCVPPAPRA